MPYIRSPLSQQVEFAGATYQDEDENEEEDPPTEIHLKSQPGSYTSSHAVPTFAPTWVEKPSSTNKAPERPRYKRHRRIDTATLIALAAKPFLTPHRMASLFAIVCAASYLARLLPVLATTAFLPDPVYNPSMVYHPPALFETMEIPVNSISAASQGRRAGRAKSGRPAPRVIRPAPAIQKQLSQAGDPAKWQRVTKPPESLEHPTLQVVVFDGVERAEHEAVEILERIEAGLQEDDLEETDEAYEHLLVDLSEDLEERESELQETEAEWLDDQDIRDENEDFWSESPEALEKSQGGKQIPLALQGSRRAPRPISDYLALKAKMEQQKTLFQEAQDVV